MSHFLDRLFAAGSVLTHDAMRLREHEGVYAPADWSLEAIDAIRPALFTAAPVKKISVEENTLPSWLWRHRPVGKDTAPEKNIVDVVERIAGAAVYRGWKNSLWQSEIEASVFYDETRELLLTRRLILSPFDMARLGLAWAYGAEAAEKPVRRASPVETANLILQNETIDAILGAPSPENSTPAARTKWLRFLETSQRRAETSVAFADTIAEWGAGAIGTNAAPRAMLNLTAFMQEDGSLDVAGIEQASKIGILLLELFYDRLGEEEDSARPVALGFCNLAGLLMRFGLPYDSRVARGTAAAIAALLAGAASAASSELAARLGICKAFNGERERLLRKMENQARAAFGEKNDYDRLSVPPQPLDLESGVNLVLLSAARHVFEKALESVRAHGLRHLQVTSLFADPSFAALAEAFSEGVEPEAALCCSFARDENEHFERRVNPAVLEGLARRGYDTADIEAARRHIAGYRTLRAAPGVSLASLKEKGFDEEALARLEAYLPQVEHVKTAFTPWILGVDFCRKKLGIPAKYFKNASFDLLRFLGFTPKDIALANAFCCGHSNLRGLAEITEKDAEIFAAREDMAPEAIIKMAAAVQSFLTGDVKLSLTVPSSITAQVRGELVLMAWKRGLRSLTLRTEGGMAAPSSKDERAVLMKRKTQSTRAFLRKKAALPAKGAKPARARAESLALKPRGGKASFGRIVK